MVKQLIDPFGRVHDYIRISITDKCNLRCVYCMPEEGLTFFPDESVLSKEEIIQLVKNFAALGITKVRLTGGEPLMRKDVVEIISGIKAIPEIEDISLTTNGLALPRLGKKLSEAGLDRLNISLDTFDENKYREITRGGSLRQVLKGIEVVSQLPFKKIKINTVVIKGQNEEELKNFLAYTKDHPVNIRFIEFMPIGSGAEKEAILKKNYAQVEEVFEICQKENWEYQAIDLKGNGPSDNYQIKGALGSFGLIHPISCRFCENCNRLRVTADGYLKACLYWDDEIQLRETIFEPEKFKELIEKALRQKPENHEMALEKTSQFKKPTWRHMSQIGG